MIRSETNENMDPEGHYPKNTISHCIISNETQITMHFFQGRISAMPEMTACLFLAIRKTGMCLLTSSCLKRFAIYGSQLAKVSKKLVSGLFKSKLKFRMILRKLVIKTLIL